MLTIKMTYKHLIYLKFCMHEHQDVNIISCNSIVKLDLLNSYSTKKS